MSLAKCPRHFSPLHPRCKRGAPRPNVPIGTGGYLPELSTHVCFLSFRLPYIYLRQLAEQLSTQCTHPQLPYSVSVTFTSARRANLATHKHNVYYTLYYARGKPSPPSLMKEHPPQATEQGPGDVPPSTPETILTEGDARAAVHEADFDRMSESELHNWYYDNLELIPSELQETWEAKLNDEGVHLATLCADFASFLARRRSAVSKLRSGSHALLSHENHEVQHAYMEMLSGSMRQDNFLGNGATAETFVTDEHPDVCIKYVNNNEKYIEGNNVREEAAFLEQLADFTVAGVRTPHLRYVYSGGGFVAIVMERVQGVTLQRVIEGLESLPPTFDFEVFFSSLQKYIDAMHTEKRVYHRDLYLRNIMVDESTGLPVVIDFGKAVAHPVYSEREEIDEKQDIAQLQAAKSTLWAFLQKNQEDVIIQN